MPKACDWNNNHLACTNTWGLLLTLAQIKSKFSVSGDIVMSALAYWNPAASSDQRLLEARKLADNMDRMAIKLLRAKYETGVNRAVAIEAMAATLTVASKTVCELSMTVDLQYRFQGEIT